MSEHKPPEQIGPYTIIEEIADNPIARLCRAEHEQSGHRVLLRILHPLASRNERLRAAIEDMRDPLSQWRISDPAVLRVVNVGKVGESYFIATEDFDGVGLDEFLRAGRPTLREDLRLALLMAEALRSVHARRIVHGDIKPQNFLVGKTPGNRLAVKLAMADLAHSAADTMISVCGDLIGTPKYMSPEQIRGKRVTHAADLFALGIILYEMFSGRQPFPAANPLGHLQSNLEATPRPLAMVDTAVPAHISQIVERLLQKDPARRYRRTENLVEDLERAEALLEGSAPAAVPPGTDSVFAPAPEPRPRHSPGPWRAVAITALAMTVLLFAALLFVFVESFRQLRKPPLPIPGHPEPVAVQSPRHPAQPAPGDSGGQTPKPPAPPPAQPPQVPSASPPYSAETLQSALAELDDAVNADNFAETAKQAERLRALHTSPADREKITRTIGAGLLARGQALHETGNDLQALTGYKQLIRLCGGTIWAKQAAEQAAAILLSRANVGRSNADLQTAVAALEELVKEFPATTLARDALQDLPQLRARYAEAILTTDPDRAVTLLRVSAAAASADHAPDIQKKLAAALFLRAQQCVNEKQYAKSLNHLREAKPLDPTRRGDIAKLEAETLYRHAKDLRQQGDFAHALIVWEKLRADYPSSPWVGLGTREGLAKIAKTVGPEHRNNADILMKMALDKIAANQRNDARTLLKELLAKHPESEPAAQAAETLAEWELEDTLVHWRAGRIPQGISLLNAISKNYPGTKAAAQAAQHLKQHKDTPKDMVLVPGGEFALGLDPQAADQLAAEFRVPRLMRSRTIDAQTLGQQTDLPSFYIDKHEVTNAQYKAFADATGAEPPHSSHWVGKDLRPEFQQHPVAGVTCAQAYAYAKWAGKRLPTEKEWEKAARGTDGRVFPWGRQFDPEYAVTAARRQPSKGSLPVGSAPEDRSPYGVLDMAGNVQEWTQSFFNPYREDQPLLSAEKDTMRVVRGAGFDELDGFLATATVRRAVPGNLREPSLGFRCAKDIQ